MFKTWGRSWQLVKASWAVLMSNKSLLLFPLIASVLTVIISIVMLIPSVMVSVAMIAGDANANVSQIVGYIGLFLFYLVTYTVAIYFNTGLVGCALIHMDGGNPTLSDGFKIANQRLGNIIGYAALSATVGVVVRFLQERGGIVGNIVAGLGGFAWNVATFLVIPVLVVQNINPLEAVKKSAGLLRDTWGEQLTGDFSIGGIFFLIYLAVMILMGGLAFLIGSATESAAAVVTIIVIAVIMMLIIGLIQGALTSIFTAAVYRYADVGDVPSDFDVNLIRGAFKHKKKKR